MRTFVLLGLLALSALARAADTTPPDAKRIIEALKPQPRAQTPGARNIEVRPATERTETNDAPAVYLSGRRPLETPQISLSIGFDFNSSRLTPDGAKTLDQLAQALSSSQLADLRFQIEGHTDGKGGAAFNLKLSQARAEEVRRYLMFAHGVEGARLLTVGKGSSDLANRDDPLAAENRRVKIVTLAN